MTPLRRLRPALLGLSMSAACGVALAGEPHMIGPGDLLRLRYGADEIVVDEIVDLDGALSAPRLGRIVVAGMTLPEAAAVIAARNRELGLYQDGDVTLGVVAYAPVIVGGDVRRPGSAAFAPGLTVAAAVALAGGAAATGMTAEELALLGADLDARAAALAVEADRLALRAARLSAEAAGAAEIDPTARALARERLGEEAVAREAAILTTEREGHLRIRASLESGVVEADSRIALFSERIGVQERIVALQRAELDQIIALVERGIRPQNELPRFERQLTEAESRLLEVEAAVADARARGIDLSADLARLDADRRLRIAEEAAATTAALSENRLERAAVARKWAMLGLGTAEDARFMLSRLGETRPVAGDEPLRPGDILVVSLAPAQTTNAAALE